MYEKEGMVPPDSSKMTPLLCCVAQTWILFYCGMSLWSCSTCKVGHVSYPNPSPPPMPSPKTPTLGSPTQAPTTPCPGPLDSYSYDVIYDQEHCASSWIEHCFLS